MSDLVIGDEHYYNGYKDGKADGRAEAIEELSEELLQVISEDYSYPYLDEAIYCIVNDALVDAINRLKEQNK